MKKEQQGKCIMNLKSVSQGGREKKKKNFLVGERNRRWNGDTETGEKGVRCGQDGRWK